MAVNRRNDGILSPGQSVTLILTYGDGDGNHGAQWFGGFPQNPGGRIRADNEAHEFGGDGKHHYWFTLTNDGNATTFFGVEGGGFT